MTWTSEASLTDQKQEMKVRICGMEDKIEDKDNLIKEKVKSKIFTTQPHPNIQEPQETRKYQIYKW